MLKTDLIAASATNSRRLLVALHGLGDSMEGYRWLPQMLRLPWLNYLLVNAPDPYYGGFSWYDIVKDPAPGVQRSRESLKNLLDGLKQQGFAPGQIVLFGFSQGCLMTLDVGLRYPEKFAALVGVSGYIHEPGELIQDFSPVASQQRILMTHGTQDTLIPVQAVRTQVEELKRAGAKIEWREFVKAHTIAGEDELGVIREFISASF